MLVLSPGGQLAAASVDGRTMAPNVAPAGLTAGSSAVVRADGDCLRIREAPALSAKSLTCLPEGAFVEVLEGQQAADGYTWQKVQSGGIVGWAADKYLQAAGSSVDAPCPAAPGAPAVAEPAATATASPQTVSNSRSRLSGELPAQGGYGLVVWGGGTVGEIAASAAAGGCTLSAVWATTADGVLLPYIYGALDVVNQAWQDVFGGDEVPAGTAVLLVCGTPTASALTSSPLSDAAAEGTASTTVQMANSAAPSVGAKAVAVLDSSTGTMLYEQQSHVALPPASLTKMVTAILAIQSGDLDAWVKTDVDSRTMIGSSLMGLLPGDCFQLRDLVYGLMLPSGNDAALAIARYVAGSDAAFVEQMNGFLASLGLADSHFVNPHGLDASGHVVSAYDLAMVADYGMSLPFFAQVVSTPQWTAKGSRTINLPNVNGFLSSYPGADGVKTGYTEGAGRTLVASATREGRRIFVVLLNDMDRYEDAAKLMDWAFE